MIKDAPNWRDYQKRLRRRNRRKAFLRKLPSLIFYSGCSVLILLLICMGGVWISAYRSQAGIPPEGATKEFVDFRENQAEQNDWRQNNFVFTSVPVSEVFEEIERQYAVTIEFPADLDFIYTGNFHRQENIEDVLHLICTPLGLKFSKASEKQWLIQNE